MGAFDSLATELAYGIYGGTPIPCHDRYEQNLTQTSFGLCCHPTATFESRWSGHSQSMGCASSVEYNAILSAIGWGQLSVMNRMQTDSADLCVPHTLEKLVELGLIEAPGISLVCLGALPYRVSDPALRFLLSIVARYRSELELDDPIEIWRKHIGRAGRLHGADLRARAQQAYVRCDHAWNCRSCANGADGRD